MSTPTNANGNGAPGPTWRLRFDTDTDTDAGANVLGPRHSGRRFVLGAALGVLVVCGVLALAFRAWQARYRVLAEFGRREVAPAVEPLADLAPPGVAPATWRNAVADTRALLVVVTASGLLSEREMTALRDELRGRVAGATGATAVSVLKGIWDDLEARAGPIVTRKPQRPPYPPRRPALLAEPGTAS